MVGLDHWSGLVQPYEGLYFKLLELQSLSDRIVVAAGLMDKAVQA